MRGTTSFLLLSIALLFWPTPHAHAFPEMVRHGYAHCIACHVSPDGGGVLTAYGRSLSREILSTWGEEGEERFIYPLTPPDWLLLGGDVRLVQTYYSSTTKDRARLIFMQADVEAAARIEQWTVAASLGRAEPTSSNSAGSNLISRRHYVNYRPTDSLSFRLGRFALPYGINLPDHYISVKRGLRWDEGSESYNLEATYLSDDFDLFLTGTVGRPDNKALNRDEGVALRGSRFIAEKFKVGGSYFYGSSPLGRRHVVGPYAILGFTPHLFVLAEMDFQNITPPSGASRHGLMTYVKIDHEVRKGIHLYLSHEYAKLDLSKAISESHAIGVGTQLFLRPHWELNASYQKQQIRALGNEFADSAWIVFHFYL